MSVDRTDHLWREHRARLLTFVGRRVGSQAEAEDIVQDVLVRAWSRRTSLQREERVSAWLYQIARNAIVDHYRRRHPEGLTSEEVDEIPDLPGDSTTAAVRELALCLRPMIDALPTHYRDALLAAEIEGLTQRETAERLNLSHSGAKSRIQRGRALLASKMEECCRIEHDRTGRVIDYECRSNIKCRAKQTNS